MLADDVTLSNIHASLRSKQRLTLFLSSSTARVVEPAEDHGHEKHNSS
ncbi:hypothetical protein PI125_g17049 [Phytophthora idaei]|nr:hypothetical protein PI125_g17049 [Phytophthora idaei]